jgi:hypothetical protein
MNDSRGSLWRRWDLHFHTPTSSCYEDKSVSNKNIIDAIKIKNMAAVAITDHHIIDVNRIKELQQLAKNEVTIFPGIELRTNLGGSESIHIIGIFADDSDIDDIWAKLQGPLEITASDISKKGEDKVYCDFKKAVELIRKLNGIISIHAGSKTNTIENITNALSYKEAIKEDIVNTIDIYEIGQAKDIATYKEKVFPDINKYIPMILCSDNHNAKKYTVKDILWIKADPTFDGLRQILYEPEHRVYIGDTPPVIQRVEKNQTKYIKSIRIDKRDDSSYEEELWFRGIRIDINPELVAIIGNKGSGKSALADIIGLSGNSKNYNNFSFLNDDKFRRPRENKANHFIGTIEWVSSPPDSRILSDNPEDYDFEKVKYFPQKYLEVLCNEEKDKFEEELENVIFSHVPEEDRLGKSSLKELIAYIAEAVEERIVALKEKIADLNNEIIKLEDILDPVYKNALKEQLKVKEEELRTHDSMKPNEVKEPSGDEAVKYQSKEIVDKIKALVAEQQEIGNKIASRESKKIIIRKKEAITERLFNKIETFREYYDGLIDEIKGDSEYLKLDPKKFIAVNIDTSALEKIKSDIASDLIVITRELDPKIKDSLQWKHAELDKRIKDLSEKLDEPNRRYQEYLKQIAEWENKKKELIGDEETLGSIEYLKTQIKYIGEKARIELEVQRTKRIGLSRLIFQEKKKLIDIYRQLYAPVDNLLADIESAGNPVRFDATIEIKGFVEQFFDHINHRVKGSFMGTDEGTRELRHIVDKTDFDDEESVVSFLHEVISCLERDHRAKERKERLIKSQIKTSSEEFYKYIFSLDYLEPRFTLKLGNVELPQLSPGERGALLLIFYLMIDKNDIPLIIDQPEENLVSCL